MSATLRVAHYINQFFGGIGGEEKAYIGPQLKDSFVGPGKLIQDVLKERGEVVATVICGDNYFAERTQESVREVLASLTHCRPDVVIAGPAFDAGRYGIACGEVCKAVQDKLGIPAVTGMHEDNPGVGLYHRDIYITKTSDSAMGMAEAVSLMVNIACKLAVGGRIGRPAEEGYFPRGVIRNEPSDRNAAERAISMVLAKIQGEPFEPEIELPKFDKVQPAPPIKDLASAKIALVTDGGLVPKGNPGKLEHRRATKFGSYSIKGLNTLVAGDFEGNHIGYDTVFVNQDPNRLVPLDVMRDLEKEGVIGELNNTYYVLAGVGTGPESAKNLGQGIAERLKIDGVMAVLLTST